MRKSILVLFIVTSFFMMATSAAAQSGVQQAHTVVVDQVLNGDTTGVKVYCSPNLTTPGMTVGGWRTSLTLPDAAGYLCFVDDMPEANWEHPARLVFVDSKTRAWQVYDMKTPPRDFSDFVQMGEYVPKARALGPGTTRFKASRLEASSDAGTVAASAPASNAVPDENLPDTLLNLGPNHKFAVIISGGYDAYNNHPRYWNDISFLYTVLTHTYGYNPAHIFVLAADGTDPAIDRSDGVSSPTDLDGDGEPDIDYPATKAAITEVFGKLAHRMKSDDFLFVFTTDHGGQDEQEPGMGLLYLWDDSITAADFAAQVNRISSYDTMVFAMEQCYSGGFKDYLSGPRRVFMSAAAWDEQSYAMGPDYQYDEFSYYLTSALAGFRPDWGIVNADQDGDGVASFAEAYAFAVANDNVNETPQFTDQSPFSRTSGAGAHIVSLDGRFGTAFTLENAEEFVQYSIDASSGTRLEVYAKDSGHPGDRWRVSLGRKATMRVTTSGSTSNWFSPAVISCFGPRAAKVEYASGKGLFPASGVVKFVLKGGRYKKMTVENTP